MTYYTLILQFIGDRRIKFDPFTAINKSFYQQALLSLNKQYIEGNLTAHLLRYLNLYWKNKLVAPNSLYPNIIDFIESEGRHLNFRYVRNYLGIYIDDIRVRHGKEYLENIERIKKYAYVNDHELYEKCLTMDYFDMTKVNVTDLNGKAYSLDEIALLTGKKYLIIDMWASWCLPCRKQMPAFHKIKQELLTKDIAFINISTDSHIPDWKKALEEEGLKSQPFQYRLANSQKSELAKFFKMQTIPRYLVLENSGRVISRQFYLPTDKEFKPGLEKIITFFR